MLQFQSILYLPAYLAAPVHIHTNFNLLDKFISSLFVFLLLLFIYFFFLLLFSFFVITFRYAPFSSRHSDLSAAPIRDHYFERTNGVATIFNHHNIGLLLNDNRNIKWKFIWKSSACVHTLRYIYYAVLSQPNQNEQKQRNYKICHLITLWLLFRRFVLHTHTHAFSWHQFVRLIRQNNFGSMNDKLAKLAKSLSLPPGSRKCRCTNWSLNEITCI